MEALLPQATFDCMDRFLYPENCDLPVIGSTALDQILQQASSVESICKFTLSMERMSPDSTMEGLQKVPSVKSDDSILSANISQQPDSTTSDINYDSDAFNSDDSNESLPELLNGAGLMDNTHMRGPTSFADVSFSPASNYSASASPASTFSSDSDILNNNNETQNLNKSSNQTLKPKKMTKKTKKIGQSILSCEMCSYTTRHKEHLTSHMNSHYSDRKYMCSDCGQTFKWSHSLKRHQRTHQSDFRYICQYCNKAFSRKDHLTIHENLHTQVSESFPCTDCGATFKNKKTLTGHMKTHSNQKQFKCDQCDSEFTRKASLTRHIKAAHAGEVITCPLCPATFSYRNTLEDHKKAVHNQGRREFACELCGVQFAVKAYLSKHVVTCRNRADGKSFPCSYCTKSFPSKRHLHEHSKRKHPAIRMTLSLTDCSNNDNNKRIMAEDRLLQTPVQTKESNKDRTYSSIHTTSVNLDHQYPVHYHHQPLQQQHPQYLQHNLHYPQPQPNPPSCTKSNFPSELCASTLPMENNFDTHLLSQINSPPALTGNDLPLPQISEPGEENVGSLLRLVYSCSEQNEGQPHYESSSRQEQQMYSSPMEKSSASENIIDYHFIDTLALDCL